ncbi:MAG: hypothetical protein O3A14_05690 [Cyanobacteria bacterium]|nr:hypothetical protein [Cyanobacteriota bacterium]
MNGFEAIACHDAPERWPLRCQSESEDLDHPTNIEGTDKGCPYDGRAMMGTVWLMFGPGGCSIALNGLTTAICLSGDV